MGNQITAIAPAQILPLENYFNDLIEFSKPVSLGSTRFFKVARATHKEEGEQMVVKVFAKHDPSLQLGPYEKRLVDIKIRLHGIANALPFQAFWETDKAAFLVRQHVHYNLYDRISTRPFLSVMEKKWIVFQLLKVLEECHSKKVCHGDIKTENVLLTGWDWVLLTDYASFKPTSLPADNPADYSFFFDTSRRRTCYIAPERFYQEQGFSNTTQSEIAVTFQSKPKHLSPAMDIFSLGCVIAELFTDGRALFDLSQLLEYCSEDVSSDKTDNTLKTDIRISDKYVRRMVRHMIQLKPKDRYTATQYLSQYKELIFPEYFYSFLHDYFKHFSVTSQLTADQCIQKLYGDIEAILANVLLGDRMGCRETGYGDALVIILSAITSHLRIAQFSVSKLRALEMMKQISHYITDECILERVVPFLVILVKDKQSSVRAEAVRTLTHCLGLVKHLPRSDFNLFPEFILPSLNRVPNDGDVMVRIAFAESVADLARTAHRFLELAQLQANQDADESSLMQYQVQGSYDSELTQLQESFQAKIVHLLSDTESSVKKSFLKHSAGKLCVFFGPQRAKEVILSHMITFLNDKSDWELHGAFFECIISVAMLLGHRSLPILEPLLQQGLSDPEETVVCKTIEAMTALCQCKLFDHHALVENIGSIAPFLVHPNIWVRYGAVGFLCTAAKQMDDIDVECYVLPKTESFLKHHVIQLKEEAILLTAMKEPIPRGVLDYVLRRQNIREIFECLTDRQVSRNVAKPGEQVRYKYMEETLVPTFRKLQSLGLNEEHENSLMALKDHILKQYENRQLFQLEVDSKGVLDFKEFHRLRVTSRHKALVYHNPLRLQPPLASAKKRAGTSKASLSVDSKQLQQPNEDWDRIFGGPSPSSKQSTKTPPKSIPSDKQTQAQLIVEKVLTKHKEKPISANNVSPLLIPKMPVKGEMSRSTEDAINTAAATTVDTASEAGQTKSLQGHRRSHSDSSASINRIGVGPETESKSRSSRKEAMIPQPLAKVEHTSCMDSLQKLLEYKQEQYVEDMKAMDNDLARNASFHSSSGWSPKGQLIAHIHQHKEAINRICVLPDSPIFASFSDDGTTKVWDVQKLEGRNLINKARSSYSQQGGQIKTGIFCLNNTSIAAASDNGTIHVFTLENMRQKGSSGARKNLLHESTVDPYKCGTIVDMAHFTAGGQNVICYATTHGKLCGLDLRSSDERVWELTNNAKFGLVLSMAVDPFENWVALGTSLGYHVIWDMRFQLPITNWQHEGHCKPHVHHVYQLSAHPTHPSSLISAVSCNNEVSVWDMETATRRQMLWASPAQPFGEMTDNPHQHESVRGQSTCIVDNCPVVLTGGTDRVIRLWNLVDTSQNCCIVRPNTHSKRVHIDYKLKIIEGVEVFTEFWSTSSSSSGTAAASPDLAHPESSHVHSHMDYITDLSVVPYKNKQFIVSASHDGVLKLWK